MKEIEDVVIVSAAKGEPKAFRAVYDHYSPFLWKVIFRMVHGERDDSQEILQNVFITVYHKVHSYQFKAAFSTWIYRIAYNEAISFLNARRRVQKKSVPFTGNELTVPEKRALFETTDLVDQILDTLTEQERFLLVAREIDAVSYEALAEIMGMSSGALRIMLFRLKEKIKKRFPYDHEL
jgi:RNA polymerase sigma-70 factor (ECF subfamily)